MVVTLFFSPKPPKRSFAAVGGSGGFDNYIFANCCAFLRRVRARTESVAQVRSGGASGHGPLDEADVQLRIGDALVREAETGSGAAFGRRETLEIDEDRLERGRSAMGDNTTGIAGSGSGRSRTSGGVWIRFRTCGNRFSITINRS
uniref:(northern house mosquito) hypothetical protein n=1 Tax=Culex pipiens TaxID=7175 RepID=A0A8D8B8C8_CULPI